MAEERSDQIAELLKITELLNKRIDKLVELISTYFAMSNNFALESLKTSLKEV